MYWQRNLPHWIPEDATVFVTWRLAGTLPMPKPAFLTNDPKPGKSFARHDRKLDRMQSGPVWLKDPRIASIVISALQYGEKRARIIRSALLGRNAEPPACRPETAPTPVGDHAVAQDRNSQPRQSDSRKTRHSILAARVLRPLDSIRERILLDHSLRRTKPSRSGTGRIARRMALVQRPNAADGKTVSATRTNTSGTVT